jgi:formate hydrogenlyase subunit 6/NADH:ubiquinone oxidoreductase subunit I
MRVCPTNVLQPAGFAGGWEGLWTPVLNNRIGTSGCQLNCIACGHACPTGAIRPLTLDEKHGTGEFEAAGPVRIGLAFVDQGRCLPWAMAKPCIVCEENCPVTPKAIYVSPIFQTVRDGTLTVASAPRVRR